MSFDKAYHNRSAMSVSAASLYATALWWRTVGRRAILSDRQLMEDNNLELPLSHQHRHEHEHIHGAETHVHPHDHVHAHPHGKEHSHEHMHGAKGK